MDISIYLRESDCTLLNALGGEIRLEEDLPGCFYTQTPTVKVFFRLDNGTGIYTGLQTGSGVRVAIDSDFNHATTPMARTTTGFTIDVDAGSIEFVLNANTTQWGTALGASASLGTNAKMEIQITPPGETNPTKVYQFTFVAKNVMDIEGTPAPSGVLDDYVSEDELEAALWTKLGTDTYAGEWAAGIYTIAEWVAHNGSSYLCIVASTTEEPGTGTDWGLIVSKGDKGDKGDTGVAGIPGATGVAGIPGVTGLPGANGLDGTGWIWRGDWDADTEYNADNGTGAGPDAVTADGSLYISLSDANEGNIPNESELDWLCVVSKGDKGDTGDTGATGPSGPAGPSGADGEDGTAIHVHDYDPSPGDGTDGDLWINELEGTFWKKVSGAWTCFYTITGAAGWVPWENDDCGDAGGDIVEDLILWTAPTVTAQWKVYGVIYKGSNLVAIEAVVTCLCVDDGYGGYTRTVQETVQTTTHIGDCTNIEWEATPGAGDIYTDYDSGTGKVRFRANFAVAGADGWVARGVAMRVA